MSSPLSTLRRLGNQQLLRDLKDLVRRDRHVEADLLAHIAEVDSRKLFREEGYSSLFRYLVEELRFSEDAAYSRIQAARAARDYPVILDRIREGELHLTGVKLLAPHLTEANHLELLDRAKCKTRQRIEELVANLARDRMHLLSCASYKSETPRQRRRPRLPSPLFPARDPLLRWRAPHLVKELLSPWLELFGLLPVTWSRWDKSATGCNSLRIERSWRHSERSRRSCGIRSPMATSP